jgi:phage major head subunit gpT-like protein
LAAGTNLSWSTFDAARTAMRQLTFENGEPAGVNPTHMRVGPALESRAKAILEAKERIRFTDMTTADTTTLAQNATAVTNVWAGELTLVVDPRVTNYFWDLYDLSKPGVRPIELYEGQAPHPVNLDQMTDYPRYTDDVFVYGLEADFVFDSGMWMVGYRATGTA